MVILKLYDTYDTYSGLCESRLMPNARSCMKMGRSCQFCTIVLQYLSTRMTTLHLDSISVAKTVGFDSCKTVVAFDQPHERFLNAISSPQKSFSQVQPRHLTKEKFSVSMVCNQLTRTIFMRRLLTPVASVHRTEIFAIHYVLFHSTWRLKNDRSS